jgi:hypothetical protein
MPLHIIYTDTSLLLSKRRYASWHDIQDAYHGFKTSLGPWNASEVITYLAEEHPDLSPSAATQVAEFVARPEEAIALRFLVDRRTA